MNMHYLLHNSSSLKKNFVFQLQSSTYPLLFIHKLLPFLQKQYGIKKQVLDVQQADYAQVVPQLEMSFLGQQKLYWLGDLSSLPVAQAKKWSLYLAQYTGPHYIVFFSQKEEKRLAIVNLPEKITCNEYKDLTVLWDDEDGDRLSHYASVIFKKCGNLTLDQAVAITEYGTVLGSARQEFENDWLENIIKPESSLFTLSGALFAGNKDLFFEQWKRLQIIYEFPFWLAYFSEQFFRAYHYVAYRRNRQLVEAKKIGFKLPFSFLQRDWQLYEPHIFVRAHDLLYSLDYTLKNGGSDLQLERMFLLFFNQGS